ncbi:hypothetical protein CISG_05985 [Coccidioides immitis RMSCC 3703]|uniref:Uncharacterized protein n=1 Tax=Coccidioides immitis RMSCC 3703 TaxID=454286 RepID=A0A0J8QZW5_COCIT|nr:hypothetical protein CISG_05985 [Coccidioides immitis RMSCC 3703]
MEEARSPEGQRVTTAAGVVRRCSARAACLLAAAGSSGGLSSRYVPAGLVLCYRLLLIPAIGTFSQSRCVLRRISLVQYLDWGLPSQFPLRWLSSALIYRTESGSELQGSRECRPTCHSTNLFLSMLSLPILVTQLASPVRSFTLSCRLHLQVADCAVSVVRRSKIDPQRLPSRNILLCHEASVSVTSFMRLPSFSLRLCSWKIYRPLAIRPRLLHPPHLTLDRSSIPNSASNACPISPQSLPSRISFPTSISDELSIPALSLVAILKVMHGGYHLSHSRTQKNTWVMASGLENIPSVHAVGGQSRAFGTAKASWKNDVWGNGHLTDAFSDGTRENGHFRASKSMSDEMMEGKSGSSCLLATSESDGWDGRANMPWNVSPSHGHSLTPPGIDAQSRDSSPPYFSASRPAAIGTAVKSSAQRAFFTQSDPQSVAVSSVGTPSGSTGYMDHNTPPRNINPAAFKNSNLGARFGSGATLPLTNSDMGSSDNLNGSLGFRPFQAANVGLAGKSTGPYTHLSRNSMSSFSQRPAHSSHSSFHSDSDGNDIREPRARYDIAHEFSKLGLEGNSYVLHSHSNSHRSAYMGPSFDGSVPHFKSPFGDEVSGSVLRAYSPEPFSDMSAYQSIPRSRHGERGMGSPSLNDYVRNTNKGFESANGTPPAAPRLVISPGNRLAAILQMSRRNFWIGSYGACSMSSKNILSRRIRTRAPGLCSRLRDAAFRVIMATQ